MKTKPTFESAVPQLPWACAGNWWLSTGTGIPAVSLHASQPALQVVPPAWVFKDPGYPPPLAGGSPQPTTDRSGMPRPACITRWNQSPHGAASVASLAVGHVLCHHPAGDGIALAAWSDGFGECCCPNLSLCTAKLRTSLEPCIPACHPSRPDLQCQ